MLAAVAVVVVFGLSVWASPLAAAIVLAPLVLLAAFAAAPSQGAVRASDAARSTITAGFNRQTRHGHRISILDPETGLLQRWYFELRTADEARRCRRYGMSMSVLFVRIEPQEAHAQDPDWSTEVQMDLVQILARQMRGVDLASRIDEREFALCLPHTGEEGALSLAWRISQNVGSYEVTMRKALAPDQGFDLDALSEAAEAFIPQEPISKPVEEAATHPELVQLIKRSPYGEIKVPEGQTVHNTKSKLRRASNSAGIEIRIWEANGLLHFERKADTANRAVA